MGLVKSLSTVLSHSEEGRLLTVARAATVQVAKRTGAFTGESVMADHWDLLIVLDACRPDALETVSEEFDLLPNDIDTRYSVGSASDKWMDRTFTDAFKDEMSETIQVTANPNTDKLISDDDFQSLKEVWRTGYDDKVGTTPPRPVTEKAIDVHRQHNPDRLITHYMQPHFPSIPDPLGFGIRKGATNPEDHEWIWHDGPPDEYTRTDIWKAYIENLRFVLNDVEVLLQNVDAETAVITADHGNAFGEWGLWGHPHQALPVLRKVPWVETSARDTQSLIPQQESDGVTSSVDEQLNALGYKT